jgi:hypothetical protein
MKKLMGRFLCCITLHNLLLHEEVPEKGPNYDEADYAEAELGEHNDLMQPTLQASMRREQLCTFVLECTGQI